MRIEGEDWEVKNNCTMCKWCKDDKCISPIRPKRFYGIIPDGYPPYFIAKRFKHCGDKFKDGDFGQFVTEYDYCTDQFKEQK